MAPFSESLSRTGTDARDSSQRLLVAEPRYQGFQGAGHADDSLGRLGPGEVIQSGYQVRQFHSREVIRKVGVLEPLPVQKTRQLGHGFGPSDSCPITFFVRHAG